MTYIHAVVSEPRRCAQAAVRPSGGYGCAPRAWRSRTPKAIPCAVHPFEALGGYGSGWCKSSRMRWLADYRVLLSFSL